MKGTSSCCQAGPLHPLGRRPCLVDRHVQPLAPRGNGKATTYRAPLATPGVGAGLTAATISSAVRAFSRSAIRRRAGRFQRSFWQLLQARVAAGGHPAGAVRLPAGASACGSHTARHVTPSAARNTGSGALP